MYCIPVLAGDRGKLTEDEIASQVLHVLSEAPCLPVQPPMIGLLTAEPRSLWARDRIVLLQDGNNARNIELIEQALLLIALDESLPSGFNAHGYSGAPSSTHFTNERDETNMAQEMIHGGGSEFNTPNRWFDKTLQIIICNDGSWGLCYEHSCSEGGPVVLLVEQIQKAINEMPSVEEGNLQNHLPPPEKLEWVVCPEIENRIKAAQVSVDRMIGDLDFYVYRYKTYGKNFIKSQAQASPDVFVQLALQLAHYK